MPTDGSPLLLIIPVHVDDGLAATNSDPLYDWFIDKLGERFELKDLGPASMYLGMRLDRDLENNTIHVTQRPFAESCLRYHNLLDSSSTPSYPHSIPIRDYAYKLPPAPANSLPNIPNERIKEEFQRTMGQFTWLSCMTRPDLAWFVMEFGQFLANPKREHLLAAKGVWRYVLGTLDRGLLLGGLERKDVYGMCDADWAMDMPSRRSVAGSAFFAYGGLVAWSASRQKTVALSSTEAEYMSVTHSLREALWMRSFLTSLSLPFSSPFPLECDNRGTIDMASTEATTPRSKHIDVRYHFIRDHVASKAFKLVWVPTADMTADIFTKPLADPLFSKHVAGLGLVDVRH
jgi:hypothetical protein